MRVVSVIPARYASTRFPGKPLAQILGKPMIQWVYESASKARGVQKTLVATDDERIVQAVRKFGGEAVMTSSDLVSGTDRVAQVAEKVEGDVFINVQGDEPLLRADAIENALQLVTSGRFQMASVMGPLESWGDLADPSVVKVLVDHANKAIYFSRFGIPYSRGGLPGDPSQSACRRHMGLYVYTRETLMRLRSLPASPIERGESLEQLRALENGIAIGMGEVDFISIGVDTPADLEKAQERASAYGL